MPLYGWSGISMCCIALISGVSRLDVMSAQFNDAIHWAAEHVLSGKLTGNKKLSLKNIVLLLAGFEVCSSRAGAQTKISEAPNGIPTQVREDLKCKLLWENYQNQCKLLFSDNGLLGC